MNIILLFTTCFMILLSLVDSVWACTSFAVYSHQVLYGMNFDFSDVAMKFLITTHGDLKTFHLAFERMFGDVGLFVKTAGMNTKGLFGSCQEQRPSDDCKQALKDGDLYVFQVYESIGQCDDVSSVEILMKNKALINLPDLNLHNLFADTNGCAMITESGDDGNKVTHIDGPYMAMTNFAHFKFKGQSHTEVEGTGANRYKQCHEYLQDNHHHFTIENGFDLLQRTWNRDPDYPTQCSMVFDPQACEVYIAVKRNMSNIFRVSLETQTLTMWKGRCNALSGPLVLDDAGIKVSDLNRI